MPRRLMPKTAPDKAARGCRGRASRLFGAVADAGLCQRNRVISGLSLATIIVDTAERSGCLMTARFALERGRGVMAA
jgi:hypothetical protein